MTIYYVRSTDGSDADNGSTWALAFASIHGASLVAGAGDTVYVSQVHAESQTTNRNDAWGTLSSPTRVICANDGAEPPTAVAIAATYTITNASVFAFDACVYMYGISHNVSGVGAGGYSFFAGDAEKMVFEKCQFKLDTISATAAMKFAATNRLDERVEFIDSDIKFGNVAQGITMAGAELRFRGGSALSGGVTPTTLITAMQTGCGSSVTFENFDFSNFASTFNITYAMEGGQFVMLRNCCLPNGWSGALSSTTPTGGRAAMYNCSAGTENYKLWIEEWGGTIRDETIITRFEGAQDGDQGLAWKITSSANTLTWGMQFKTDEIVRKFPASDSERAAWTPGAAVTVTVEIIHDSATNLTDSDVWLEVDSLSYLGSPQYTGGERASDRTVGILTASADQTASNALWYDQSPSMANPNKQKLSVTIHPQVKGYLHARVVLAKASKTIYIDPLLVINGVGGGRQYQIPGGPYVNEAYAGEEQIPLSQYLNETGQVAASPAQQARYFFSGT